MHISCYSCDSKMQINVRKLISLLFNKKIKKYRLQSPFILFLSVVANSTYLCPYLEIVVEKKLEKYFHAPVQNGDLLADHGANLAGMEGYIRHKVNINDS